MGELFSLNELLKLGVSKKEGWTSCKVTIAVIDYRHEIKEEWDQYVDYDDDGIKPIFLDWLLDEHKVHIELEKLGIVNAVILKPAECGSAVKALQWVCRAEANVSKCCKVYASAEVFHSIADFTRCPIACGTCHDDELSFIE